jgi:hypothetical protein
MDQAHVQVRLFGAIFFGRNSVISKEVDQPPGGTSQTQDILYVFEF